DDQEGRNGEDLHIGHPVRNDENKVSAERKQQEQAGLRFSPKQPNHTKQGKGQSEPAELVQKQLKEEGRVIMLVERIASQEDVVTAGQYPAQEAFRRVLIRSIQRAGIAAQRQ